MRKTIFDQTSAWLVAFFMAALIAGLSYLAIDKIAKDHITEQNSSLGELGEDLNFSSLDQKKHEPNNALRATPEKSSSNQKPKPEKEDSDKKKNGPIMESTDQKTGGN